MSPESGGQRLDWRVAAALAAYAAAIVFVTCHHEFWEDEVRAWSIARGSGSPLALFANLHNEGHPALWYVLLYIGTRLSASPLVLPAASLLVAAAAAACFLAWSPFAWWLKILFLCGVLPLYEYSVMARNYGLGMLLLFGACALYPRRFRRPLALAAVLALLANSSVHGAILAAGFLLALGAEYAVEGRGGPGREDAREGPSGEDAGEGSERPSKEAAGDRPGGRRRVLALAIIAAGIAVCAVQVWPDETSQMFRPAELSVGRAAEALVATLWNPGSQFTEVFRGDWPLFGAAVIWVAVLALLDKPYLLLAFAGGVVGLSLFGSMVYGLGLRHQGLLVVLLMGMLWLAPSARTVALHAHLERFVAVMRKWALPATLGAVLITHVAHAVEAIRFDFEHEMTSAKRFGRLLREEFPDAIVMGEPDDALESLPYYAPNPIYIPREHRFGTWTHFTLANQAAMSLGELMSIGRILRQQTRRPVLLAFGHRFRGNRLLHFSHLGRRVFTWSDEELSRLQQETEVAAVFFDAVSENYRVYSFR